MKDTSMRHADKANEMNLMPGYSMQSQHIISYMLFLILTLFKLQNRMGEYVVRKDQHTAIH